jgi:hypothetical protein
MRDSGETLCWRKGENLPVVRVKRDTEQGRSGLARTDAMGVFRELSRSRMNRKGTNTRSTSHRQSFEKRRREEMEILGLWTVV